MYLQGNVTGKASLPCENDSPLVVCAGDNHFRSMIRISNSTEVYVKNPTTSMSFKYYYLNMYGCWRSYTVTFYPSQIVNLL